MDNAQTLMTMPGVGFIGMLIIGIIAGWIAEKATSSNHGLLTNLLVGIAGSFVGGTLANVMNVQFYGWSVISSSPRSARFSCYGSGGASEGRLRPRFGSWWRRELA